MKSLPAIVTLYIVCAISGSSVLGYGEQDSLYQQRPYDLGYNADQSSHAEAPKQKQSWLPKSETFKPKTYVRLDLDVDTQLHIFKKYGESDEDYYRRILAQRSYESYVEYWIRIEILKMLLPDLPVWNDNKYYDYWSREQDSIAPNVKQTYLDNIEDRRKDTAEEYYKRIFQKHEDENAEEYIRRICIMRSSFPSLNVWGGNAFVAYVKPNLLPSAKDKTTSASPGLFSNSRIQGSLTLSNSPSPSSSPTITSPNSPTPSDNPTILNSPKATESVPPSGTNNINPTFPQQSTPSTSAVSTPNVVYIPGKQKKLKVGQYGRLDGETDEQYCKRIIATDQPLKKKKLYSIIDNFKKVNKRFRKYVWTLCKPYVVRTKHSAVSQQASIVQQIPTAQTVPSGQQTFPTQEYPTTQDATATHKYPTIQVAPIGNQDFNTQRTSSFDRPGAQLTAGAQFTAGL